MAEFITKGQATVSIFNTNIRLSSNDKIEITEAISDIPTADVVERSEYEKLRLVNLDLAETNKGLLAEHTQLLELRCKIDKAIEEMESYEEEVYHRDTEKKEYACVYHCLEILKRNIGE